MKEELLEKYEKLKQYLASLKNVAVAFSGGVDSTFLLFAAKEALGDHCIAITASSGSFPQRETAEAAGYCEKLGVRQYVIEIRETEKEEFAKNPKNRCYVCKKDLFEKFLAAAENAGEESKSSFTLVEGSNLDDEGDYRPGLLAIAELGIKSPLRQVIWEEQKDSAGLDEGFACAGFTKQEIRELSAYFGLPTWKKPSFACLATRIPYGEQITEEKLRRIDMAEQFLLDLGFHQLRVRMHGDMARIEIAPEEMEQIFPEEMRIRIYRKFKELGFSYVALDLMGYRTGSMNEVLQSHENRNGAKS